MAMMDNSNVRVGLLVFASSLEILLFGGIQYGWSSIVFILKEEGFYKDLCSNKTVDQDIRNTSTSENVYTPNACFNQDKQLNLYYSIGMAVTNILGVVSGEMLYNFGTKLARICFLLIFVAGALMLAFASAENPWLVAPGLCLVGWGGLSLLMSNMQVVALIGSGSSIYVGILNGLFDSSVLTQTIVKEIFEAGIKRVYSYSCTAILALIISGLCTILLPSTSRELPKEDGKGNAEDKDDTNCNSADLGEYGNIRRLDEKCSEQAMKKENRLYLRKIIFGKKYLLDILWFSILELRLYYFYGAINRILEQTFIDMEKVSYFTDVLAYTMMGGLISSYFAGQLMFIFTKYCTESVAIATLLMMTSGLAILLSCLSFTESFYVTFITATVFRSFLFAQQMQFVVSCLPHQFRGFLFGLVLTVAGLVSLLQYALFVWTDEYKDAIEHVNVTLLILTVLSLAHPICLIIDSKRTNHHKQDDLPL